MAARSAFILAKGIVSGLGHSLISLTHAYLFRQSLAYLWTPWSSEGGFAERQSQNIGTLLPVAFTTCTFTLIIPRKLSWYICRIVQYGYQCTLRMSSVWIFHTILQVYAHFTMLTSNILHNHYRVSFNRTLFTTDINVSCCTRCTLGQETFSTIYVVVVVIWLVHTIR